MGFPNNLQFFKTIIENSPHAILIIDITNKTVFYYNQAAKSIFGENLESSLHDSLFQNEELHAEPDFEITIPTDHQTKVGAVSIRTLSWNRLPGKYRILYISDITDTKKNQEQLYLDELTGIPRRELFMTRINEAIGLATANNGIFAFLYIDLDGFKPINDTLGHLVGDHVLKIVAKRIQRCIRNADTVGRLGGDEFGAILLNLKDTKNAGFVARKIIESLQQEIVIPPDNTCFISASIGISAFPADSKDSSAIVQNADRAMYVVKHERGKGDYAFYSDGIVDKYQREQKIEAGLRRALTNKNEFLLHYMPQIDLQTGFLSASEALTYWKPPNEKLILPFDFIPIAEQTGLITAVEQIAFKTACFQGLKWLEEFKKLPMFRLAINLSSKHFSTREFMETIDYLLKTIGFLPSLLDIEITESTMSHDRSAMNILSELKEKQVSITLDNYGSDATSMLSLKKFPITGVKIDREFVRNITTNKIDRAIVENTINLAKQLGLRVIAQGVETETQLELLKQWGCDEAQGYYFSKPLTVEKFTRFLKKHFKKTLASIL